MLPLPSFSGRLSFDEDFTCWAHKLLAWLRLNGIPEDDHQKRNDYILLALETGSLAQRYLLGAPPDHRETWQMSLSCLQHKFASPERSQMIRTAASTALACRGFRDDKNRGETVQQLIEEFEGLAAVAGLDDYQQQTAFTLIFRKYNAATRLLQRTNALDEAFAEALRWEKVLVEKTESQPPSA